MDANAPKAKAMTKLVAQFITRGMHPYRIVEEPGFLNMMNSAMPDYTVPSRTTFSRVIVPELYRARKAEVKSNLAKVLERGVEAISLTTDSWTSRANDSYVCVTCHVMDKEFVQHVHALACAEMAECHTAENLQRFIESVLVEWEIPAEGQVPIYVVTDNGRNFVSAVARSTWQGVLCFGHTLQLCITDLKRNAQGLSQLCAKCRTIVGRYKRSATARARLLEIQREMQLDPLEVVQDVPTRWNSEHAMMARLLRLRGPITLELSESDAVENLTTSEWKLLAAAVRVLQPLDQATTALSGDGYPTLSQVIPLLECTKVVLSQRSHEPDEAAVALGLLKSIKTRFPDIKMSRLPALAMLIDPRYKDACYMEKCEKQWASKLLTTAAEEIAEYHQPPDGPSGSGACLPETPEDSVWHAFQNFRSETNRESGCSVADVVANYLKGPLLPRSSDPLVWWSKEGSQLYPVLVGAARRYLSIPATQTTSDRVFSAAGTIVSCRREHMLTKNVEQLVFLHENS